MGNGVSETISAITRAQSKNRKPENQNVESVSYDRLDHPGIVELIKRPSQSFELRLIDKKEFKTAVNNETYDYKVGNLICKADEQVIYVKEDTRSACALEATLRDLHTIVTKYNIPEIVIIKRKMCAHNILNELIKHPNEVRKLNLKLSIPYKVIENNSPNIVIRIDNKDVTVHKNRVKPYHF